MTALLAQISPPNSPGAPSTGGETELLLRDISPPVEITAEPWLPWWAVLLLGFVVGALVIWLILSHKSRESQQGFTPRQRALERLAEARVDLEKEEAYQFSIRLADILRDYLAESFSLPAYNQTSQEFLRDLRSDERISSSGKDSLRRFLRRCDEFKFARRPGGHEEKAELFDRAREFVEEPSG